MNSKAHFDRNSISILLKVEIEDNFDNYKKLITNSKNNSDVLFKYNKKIKSILEETPAFKYQKAETKQFNKLHIKDIDKFNVDVSATYVSPKGRNRYHKNEVYNHHEIENVFIEIVRERKQKNTRQAKIRKERTLMTDSLRFNILNRDGYACQICGSQASDGVKLHVDHIQPVSRGGRTIKSNLQTLCDRCNIGKAAKAMWIII